MEELQILSICKDRAWAVLEILSYIDELEPGSDFVQETVDVAKLLLIDDSADHDKEPLRDWLPSSREVTLILGGDPFVNAQAITSALAEAYPDLG